MRQTEKNKAAFITATINRRKAIQQHLGKCNVRTFSALDKALVTIADMYIKLNGEGISVLDGITHARFGKTFYQLNQLRKDSGANERLLYFYFVELKAQVVLQFSQNALCIDDIIYDLEKLYTAGIQIQDFAEEAIKGCKNRNRKPIFVD